MHGWSTFGARTSHGQHEHTRLTTAKNWGKPHLPPYVYSMAGHEVHIQMAFLSRDSRVGVPKSRQLGPLRLWNPITFQVDLKSRCGLKQSCSSRQTLSNDMLHAFCSQVNRVNSWLFLVGSQTDNLTPDPSFGHNLCFRCPNEQCEPILDIYIPRAFQWYKKMSQAIDFWSLKLLFEILGLHRDSISQSGSCLGSVRVHSFILPHTFLHSWEYVMWLLGFFLACTLATSLPWLPNFFLACNLVTPLL
jgi:hypothetical protein